METEDNLTVNKYGQAILSSNNLRELLLQGKNISHLNVVRDEEIELFEKYQSDLLSESIVFLENPDELLDFDDFHKKCADEWIFPKEYQIIDVYQWLIDKCISQTEINRVKEEYILYEERDLIMLLRLFIYLVDYMRKNDYVWGVGRGSSVSSFILYLIGIHRVNSILYELDINEFLR